MNCVYSSFKVNCNEHVYKLNDKPTFLADKFVKKNADFFSFPVRIKLLTTLCQKNYTVCEKCLNNMVLCHRAKLITG